MSDKTSDKTSDKRLLPCPFCGGEAAVEMDESWYWEWEAYCLNCHASLGHFTSKEEAITVWNTRKPMERIVERLEELCNSSRNDYGMEKHAAYMTAIEIVKEEMG